MGDPARPPDPTLQITIMSSVSFEAVVESARGGGHVVEVDRSLAEVDHEPRERDR